MSRSSVYSSNSFKYSAFYGQTNFGKVPKKIGFKVNVRILQKAIFNDVLAKIESADYVSLDTETTSLKHTEAELISINIGLPGNDNYVGFYYTGYFKEEVQDLLPTNEDLDLLVSRLLAKKICFMWNRYYDQRILMWTRRFKEEDFWTCYDGMMLLWLMDSNVKSGLGLKQAAQDFLGLDNWGMEEDVWEGIQKVDPKVLLTYGGYDAYATIELGIILYRIFQKHYPFMLRLQQECKNATFRWNETEHELDGVKLHQYKEVLERELQEVQSTFYRDFGVINLNSGPQKSRLLMSLGYNTGRALQPNKKTGEPIMGTGEDDLKPLIEKGCEPARLMVRASKLSKLLGSYITPMLNLVDEDKPVRFYLKDRDTATLRFSAGKYSVHNKAYDYWLTCSIQCIPKYNKINRDLNYDPNTFDIEWVEDGKGKYYVETGDPNLNIRSVFVPRKSSDGQTSGLIISADFAQEELRLPSVFANETVWLDAIKNHEDLHDATIESIVRNGGNRISRRLAKGFNFGMMYETNDESAVYVMHNASGLPLDECRVMFAQYKAGLPNLYRWKAKVMQDARVSGSVVTEPWGFERRVYSYYHSMNRKMQAFGDRTAVNQKIQGSAAIAMRLLMVKVWKALCLKGGAFYNSGILPLISIHDEIDIEVTGDGMEAVPEFLPWFRDMMSSVWPKSWPIKMEAELEIGKNFGELFVVEQDEATGLWLPVEEERPTVTTSTVSEPVVSASLLDEWVEEVEDEIASAGFSF